MDITTLVDSTGGQIPDQDVSDTTSSGRKPDEPLVKEVNEKFSQWRSERRPHEQVWFMNASMIRGYQNARWNPVTNTLEPRKTPSHRSRDAVNFILPKVKARLSKFLKTRPLPIITAASTDREDVLNAQATQKALEYIWAKIGLEEKYEEALLWSMQTGKSFWWFYWDQGAIAQVKTPKDVFGKEELLDVPLGDVGVEVGSAFEVLVSDPGITRIQNQHEIMRVKLRPVKEVEKQFNLPPGSLKPEVSQSDLFQYEKQIANLGAKTISGFGTANGEEKKGTHVAVKELFTRPCAAYPKGRYVVVAGDKVLKQSDELPYGLWSFQRNPFPVVEFADNITAGQFWPTTMVEQLTGIQRQYNRLRNQLDEQLKLQLHPKIFVPKQASIHPEAWHSEAGEKIPFNFQPGMPSPEQWVVRPPSIAADIWRTFQLIKEERDEISVLYPAAMGGTGGTSGFDTNLLQEAADSVHAPDIRRNEIGLEEAAFKIRRLMRLGYDIPRLVSIVGRDKQPEAFEFSQEQIDEHANIRIEAGSALPNLKAARIDAIMTMQEKMQLFGPVGDPNTNRRILRMLDLGSQEENRDLTQRDEEHARFENLAFSRSEQVEDPMPWENHDLEYEIHTDLLKSQEIKSWPPEQRAALVRHTVLHVKWKNPQNALQLASMFGFQDIVQDIQMTMLAGPQAQGQAQPAPAPGPDQPQAGQPPQAPQGEPQAPPQGPQALPPAA